jgi:hypothetical protein
MGRHSRGRHRAPVFSRIPTINWLIRKKRTTPETAFHQIDFPEPEGATDEWGDTLNNIRAVIKPVTTVMADHLDATDHLDPPTYYRRLAGLNMDD